MRILRLSLLATVMFLSMLGTANAFRVWGEGVVETNAIPWVYPGDRIEVTFYFDTEGGLSEENALYLLGVGVDFNSGLAYSRADSATPSYLLYTTAKSPYLAPVGACAAGACDTYPASDGTVLGLDFLSSQLGVVRGITSNSASSTGQFGSYSLGTYVFTVLSTYTADYPPMVVSGGVLWNAMELVLDGYPGGTLLTSQGEQPLTLDPITIRVIPEPTSAVLIGLGLVGFVGWPARRVPARP